MNYKLQLEVRSDLSAIKINNKFIRGHRDRMVVGFATTCAINAHHHTSYESESRSWRGVLDTTVCD